MEDVGEEVQERSQISGVFGPGKSAQTRMINFVGRRMDSKIAQVSELNIFQGHL